MSAQKPAKFHYLPDGLGRVPCRYASRPSRGSRIAVRAVPAKAFDELPDSTKCSDCAHRRRGEIALAAVRGGAK